MDFSLFLKLEPLTLLFSISILGFLLASVSYSFSKAWPQHNFGLNQFSLALACVGGSFLLLFLRGHVSWFLTFFLANTLVILIGPFSLYAHLRLFEVNLNRFPILLAIAFGFSGIVASYFFGAPRNIAILTVCSSVAFHAGLLSVFIFNQISRKSSTSEWISCLVWFLAMLIFGARAMSSIFRESTTLVADATAITIASNIAAAVCTVATSIGFFSMVNEKHHREIMASLSRDCLTGLFTRKAFFDIAESIDTNPTPEHYAIVMVDIDHFKAINDTYGHSGGDTTLAHAGRLIANSIRISDVAGRYGGEEFCVILRNCSESDAHQFATRLVFEAAQHTVRLRDGRDVRFTLSAGYALRSPVLGTVTVNETLDDVIERADRALYSAKNTGRNRALAAPLPAIAPAFA